MAIVNVTRMITQFDIDGQVYELDLCEGQYYLLGPMSWDDGQRLFPLLVKGKWPQRAMGVEQSLLDLVNEAKKIKDGHK